MSDYWQNIWNKNKSGNKNCHCMVHRTKHNKPISDGDWNKTLDFILSNFKVNKTDTVLDVCCGNGLLSTPLSKRCKKVIAVDFSSHLLADLKKMDVPNINIILKDVLKLDFPKKSLSKIICNFSLQYFNNREVLLLLKYFFDWLIPKGVCYIGDIPDLSKIWNFFNTPEYEKMYFESILNDKKIIGNWFLKDFLINASHHLGFSKINIIEQPKFMFNSHYRFDLLIQK
jgi:ubiquinone/menaquinone biosynthesis C-methylase UbiE